MPPGRFRGLGRSCRGAILVVGFRPGSRRSPRRTTGSAGTLRQGWLLERPCHRPAWTVAKPADRLVEPLAGGRPSGTERRTFTFRVILRSNNIHRAPKTGGPKTDQSRKHAAKRKRGRDVSRYQTRKEQGLCRSCPNEAILGQTRCPSCAETHRQSANARNVHKRGERNQEGLCHDCKAKAAPGSTRCSQCAEEHRQRQRRYSRNPNRSRRTADTATKLVQTDLWGKPIRT